MPFRLINIGTTGEGGVGGDGAGGAGGAGESQGCTYVSPEGPYYTSSTRCNGNVRRTEIDDEPAFVFDDGSTFTWTGSTEPNLAFPEAPVGANLWVDYWYQSYHVCQWCFSTSSASISIRANDGGQVLYAGGTGVQRDPIELFGTTFGLEPTCETGPQESHCYRTTYRRYNVLLNTDPVQRIPYGEVTRISVPGGTFDVFWSHADHTELTWVENCSDGVPPTNIREFAAVRVSE